MDARFYNTDKIDIERLATDLESVYRAQGFQAQQPGTPEQKLVQIKKGGEFEALVGLQAALTIIIQHTAHGLLVTTGQQKWIDKAAVGVVGIAVPALWPLMITGALGAVRQASLGAQALNMVDGLVRQQQPDVQAGPVPAQQ